MLVSRRLAWISTEYFKSSGNVKEKASTSRQETKAFRVYWDKDSNLRPSGYETNLSPQTKNIATEWGYIY